MSRPWSSVLLVVLAMTTVACDDPLAPAAEPDPIVERAAFGIFFGGQVQQRREIPFQLDSTKQTQGLRVEFRQPLAQPAKVRWEIDMPGRGKRVRDHKGRRGEGRVTRVGEATVPSGSKRFEQPVRLKPGDSTGIWNVRIHVDGRLVLDQRFNVYDEAWRAKQIREADAGAK